jgi:hypothetical protein
MQYPPERQERTFRRDPSNTPFLSRDAFATVLWASSLFSISLSARWALQRGTENCRLWEWVTLISAPLKRFIPVRTCPSANAFRRNREVHHKPIPISPLVIAGGLSLPDTRIWEWRPLSKPALIQLQNRMPPGSSRNRCSIEQENRVGMNGEIKVLAISRTTSEVKNYTSAGHIGSFMPQYAGGLRVMCIHPSRAAGFWAPRVVTSVDGDRWGQDRRCRFGAVMADAA